MKYGDHYLLSPPSTSPQNQSVVKFTGQWGSRSKRPGKSSYENLLSIVLEIAFYKRAWKLVLVNADFSIEMEAAAIKENKTKT